MSISAAMSIIEETSRLTNLLVKEARVHPEVVKYITDPRPGGLGHESVSDFASHFTSSDYAEGVQTEILNHVEPHKEDKLQRNRLRTAWELAQAAFKEALAKRPLQDDGDWDLPLDPEVQQKQEAIATKYYHLKFESSVSPGAALFGRCFREFSRRQLSAYPLVKVKSAAQTSNVIARVKRRRIAEGVELTSNECEVPPDNVFVEVIQVLHALQILVNCWGMTGTAMLDSKANPGSKVPDGDLTEGLAYHAFVMEKALEHPGPVEQTVDWLLTRDHQTRTKACSLSQDKWPFGEALRVARETHLAVLWTCGNVGVSNQEPQSSAVISSDIPNQPPSRNASSGPNTFKPPQQTPFRFDQLCKEFNSPAGCSVKQRDCPNKKKHACSQYVGKELCLAWQHGRSEWKIHI